MSLATSRTKSRAGTLAVLILLAAAVIIASPIAYGQTGKGAIDGRAADSTGAALKGAK